jgi:two-component sensor histidine kinase
MPFSRPRSVRHQLGLLALVLAVPMLALAIVVGALQVREARRHIEAQALADARSLVQRADALIAGHLALLRRIAAEPVEGNAMARLAALHADHGVHLALLDSAGAPLGDSRAEPLPAAARAAAVALARSGALVSPLVEDPASGGHALLLAERMGAWLLVLALPAARLQVLLSDPAAGAFSDARFPALVDAEGRIIARWHEPARYIGQPMPAAARGALAATPHGVWHGESLAGVPVLVAHATSAATGIAAGVGVTAAALRAPVWQSVATLGSAVVVMLGLATIATLRVARRIAVPVAGLGAAAGALADGRPPPRLATAVAEVNTVAAAMADAAERRRLAEAQRDLLVRELHHRVKNLLTTAQSLASLSARSARDPQAFAAQFGERLRALARTHTLLLEQPDGVLAVRMLAAEVVAPYRLGVGRISLGGPDVRLPAESAVPLGMVLHELATNAVKYGALSAAEGRLDIAWRLAPAEGAPLLVLDWTETGGPPHGGPPAREGFGSQLLRRALLGLPGGKVEVMWRPEGLAVRMTLAARGAEFGPAGAATS